ncbi:MAG: glutathione S-transferase family protein [Gammaproteobacteria bacterium]
MAKAKLTITSRNYSSWSLRGWLLARLSGLPFDEVIVPMDDPSVRAELLLLSSSIRVPCLTHDGVTVWDTLAIGEYLNEIRPEAGLLPQDRVARAHCRSICGEMHSGFTALRSAMPMNLKARHPGFRHWQRARADIERITAIWNECLERHGGPYLYGTRPCMADAMFAPVATRLRTYDVRVDAASQGWCDTVLALPDMIEWTRAALAEPEQLDEFEAEF